MRLLLVDDDEDEVECGLTHEFWTEQLKFAVHCLFMHAGVVRRAGLGVVQRGREREVPKMKEIERNAGPGPTNFIIWASDRLNSRCSFFCVISMDVDVRGC